MLESGLIGRDALMAAVESSLSDRRSVVLTGHAGVGKSRLARELAKGFRQAGVRVIEARGEMNSRDVSLGAFAFLVRPDARPGQDVASTLWRLQLELVKGDGRNAMLLVDDAHLLDEMSMMLVSRIARTSDTRLLLTVRQGEDMPSGLTELWSDETVERIAVTPLDRESLETLVARLLSADVSARTAEEFWRLSKGNPLCARELVVEAQARRTIAIVGGVASHEGVLSVNGRVSELIETRLAVLPGAAAEALRLLATAGALPLRMLEEAVGTDTMADLHRRGLIQTTSDGQRQQVSTSHPLYGELMAQAMGSYGRREASTKLFGLAREVPTRRRGDVVRLAEWGLTAGATVPGELLAKAAADALTGQSAMQAERFARAAEGPDADPGLGLILANALSLQGRHDEAEGTFASLLAGDIDDRTRAAVAMAWAGVSAFAQADFHGALERLEAARRNLSQPAARDALGAQQALFSVFTAPTERVLELAKPILSRESPADVDATSIALGAAISALGFAGRLTESEELGTKASALLGDRQDLDVMQVIAPLQQQAWVSFQRGDVTSTFASGNELRDQFEGIEAVFDGAAAIIYSLIGEHTTSDSMLRETLPRLAAMGDPIGQVNWLSALRLENAAMAGAPEQAQELEHVFEAQDPAARTMFRPDIERCRAVWELTIGGRDRARTLFETSLALATELGHWTFVAKTIDDLVRFGWADDVLPIAQRIIDEAEPGWVVGRGIASHAAAAASEDPARLAKHVPAYASWGWKLRAAEIAVAASRCYRDRGDLANAYRFEIESRVRESTLDCGSPVLDQRTSVLGPRGYEVAELVATGMSDRQIADRLVLSTRTVENHVYRVNKLLGLGSRTELAAIHNAAREAALTS